VTVEKASCSTSRLHELLFTFLQKLEYLLTLYRRKILQKIVNRISGLDTIHQILQRDTRPCKHRCAAENLWITTYELMLHLQKSNLKLQKSTQRSFRSRFIRYSVLTLQRFNVFCHCFAFDLPIATCNLQLNTVSSQTAHLSAEAKASLPRHVAIIMDGNGRWAKQRHLPRIEGHRAGAESARIIIRTAGELGIKYLTLYAFSVENWNRPKDEVDALMKYLIHYLKTETPELNKNNVRLEVIGQIYRLPENVQDHLNKSIATLSKNNGLTLVMALSYGGRTEIVEAVRSVAAKVKSGQLDPSDITEQIFAQHLYTHNIPDPDLLIRTSGEMRVSNFLLWQISYTELVVTQTLWPDFRKPQFFAALEEYNRRHRRFGAL
jgi:undecaprenyl diphosphate synthase